MHCYTGGAGPGVTRSNQTVTNERDGSCWLMLVDSVLVSSNVVSDG